MTDNTLTVYEKCDHGKLEAHTYCTNTFDPITDACIHEKCPGGREIVLRLLRPKDDRGKAFQTAFGLGNVWVEVSDVS